MSWVLDSSVVVKWYLIEPRHENALTLLDQSPLLAPSLLPVEVAHVLTKRHRRRELDADACRVIRASLARVPIELIDDRDLLDTALELSLRFRHGLYDCLYLACADLTGIPLVTDDRRLIDRVERTPWRDRVVPLEALGRTAP